MTRIFHFKISSVDTGQTVNDFLRSRGFSHHIVAELKRTAGAILLRRDAPIPGQTGSVYIAQADLPPSSWISVPVSVRLLEGDLLKITLSDTEASSGITPTEAVLNILYEDEDILVINKPADMPVHPSINNHDHTLANAVAWYYQTKGQVFVFRCINRLDRDTSGAVLIAKNALASSILSADMKQRRVHRTYLAIVKGHVQEPGTVDAPIARQKDSVLMRCVDLENGDAAITHYTPVQYKNDPDLTLLRLRLDTGRTHQIRVHMNYLGYPLIGDYLYHPDRSLISRQALHSCKLEFRHPVTGKELRFVCPLPDDMSELFHFTPV